jgi:hypothetical protein
MTSVLDELFLRLWLMLHGTQKKESDEGVCHLHVSVKSPGAKVGVRSERLPALRRCHLIQGTPYFCGSSSLQGRVGSLNSPQGSASLVPLKLPRGSELSSQNITYLPPGPQCFAQTFLSLKRRQPCSSGLS